MSPTPQPVNRAIKLVAAFEAFKGLVVMMAATAVLSLVHSDLHARVLSLVEHMHLNPASKYPQIILLAASDWHNTRLVGLAIGAVAYSTVRFVEAYGLFHERTWAEVLAAGSGLIYVPFELIKFWRMPTPLHAGLLAANLAVVGIMVYALMQRRARRSTLNPYSATPRPPR